MKSLGLAWGSGRRRGCRARRCGSGSGPVADLAAASCAARLPQDRRSILGPVLPRAHQHRHRSHRSLSPWPRTRSRMAGPWPARGPPRRKSRSRGTRRPMWRSGPVRSGLTTCEAPTWATGRYLGHKADPLIGQGASASPRTT